MGEVLNTLVKVSPIAAALIVVVILFLRYLSASSKASEERDRKWLEALNGHGDRFSSALADHGRQDREVMREIAESFKGREDRVATALEHNASAFGELRGVLIAQGHAAPSPKPAPVSSPLARAAAAATMRAQPDDDS